MDSDHPSMEKLYKQELLERVQGEERLPYAAAGAESGGSRAVWTRRRLPSNETRMLPNTMHRNKAKQIKGLNKGQALRNS